MVKPVVFTIEIPTVGLPSTISLNLIIPGYQAMYEEMTPNSEGGRHRWKDFEHYKRSTELSMYSGYKERFLDIAHVKWYSGEVPSMLYLRYAVTDFGSVGNPTSGLPTMYVKRVLDNGFVPEPNNLDVLKQTALNSILPKVKAELSLLNSIVELRDFKSLPRTLAEIVKFGINTGKTLRSFFRVGSDAYLQGSFNILPLLSDISGIRAALSRTERRINDLITRQGGVQVRHFSCKLTELPVSYEVGAVRIANTLVSGGTGFYRSQNALDVRYTLVRNVMMTSSLFHAEVEYNYNYSAYQIAHAQLLGLLDAFGVKLNPAIIWNAIPWSFVVDWVANVSRWLNQYSIDNMEPVINIRRALWSITRRRYVQVANIAKPTNVDQVSFPETPVTLTIESSYRRKAFMPGTSSVQLSGLNIKEFSLGAALVIARRRRQKPH